VDDKCACTLGGNECAALNTACSLGLCDEDKGVCAVLAVNKGGPCDDGNTCTTRDVCEETHCVGHDCSQPSICLLHHECGRPGALMHVAVRLGESDVAIAGGQFTIQYDPEGMELVSISPGNECSPSSPFTVEVGSVINESSGDIFYGVGIGFDQLPTTGPAILACLTFNVLDRARSEVCTFVDVNPFNTYLVDEHGQIVQSFNGDDCPTDRPFPLTSCIEYMFCPIPTASAWGLLVLALSLATLAKIAAMRRRAA
jgi:hypothetical protein